MFVLIMMIKNATMKFNHFNIVDVNTFRKWYVVTIIGRKVQSGKCYTESIETSTYTDEQGEGELLKLKMVRMIFRTLTYF